MNRARLEKQKEELSRKIAKLEHELRYERMRLVLVELHKKKKWPFIVLELERALTQARLAESTMGHRIDSLLELLEDCVFN